MPITSANAVAESASAGGLASGLDNVLMLFCSSAGPLNTPRSIASSKAWLSTFESNNGCSEGSEIACHFFKHVRKLGGTPKIIGIRLPSTTPGAVEIVDTTDKTGTSIVTASGTPHRRMSIVVRFLTSGTVGVDGITYDVSVNGGISFLPGVLRLGTATSIVISKTGVTLSLGAGTIGGSIIVHTSAPKWATSDFNDAITAAIALQQRFRALVVVGDFNKVEADALRTQLDTLYANLHRPVAFIGARDWYRDARLTVTRVTMTGAPADVDFAASAHTITRGTGSWVTDGFVIGMRVKVEGSEENDGDLGVLTDVSATVLTFAEGISDEANVDGADLTITGTSPGDVDIAANTITRNIGSWVSEGFKIGMKLTLAGTASNDGVIGELTNVSATVLTVAETMTVEANLAGDAISVTAEETEDAWIAALSSNLGPFEDELGRVSVSAGMTRMTSEIFQTTIRVPSYVATVERWMAHDIHVSPNRKANGPLTDHQLTDDDGNVVEHDSRTNDTLNELGFLTARTFLGSGNEGAYVQKPLTAAPAGSSFRMIPWRAVANLACDVIQKATENFIGDHPELFEDGRMTDEGREDYKIYVKGELDAELRTDKGEGVRASFVDWQPSDEDILSIEDAILNAEAPLRTLGLIGSVLTRVIVNPATT